MFGHWPLCALAAGAAATTSVADAPQIPIGVMAWVVESDPGAARAAGYIDHWLDEILLGRRPVVSPPTPAAVRDQRKSIEALLDEATEHYRAGRFAEALSPARRALDTAHPRAELRDLRIACEAMRAASLAELGRSEESLAAFARLLIAAPDHRLALHGAAAHRLLARAREALLSAPTGTRTILSDPPGARVFVNGVFRGVAPVTLQLPVGWHDLRLRHPSRPPRDGRLDVSTGPAQSQAFRLPRGPPSLAAKDASMGALARFARKQGAAAALRVTVDAAPHEWRLRIEAVRATAPVPHRSTELRMAPPAARTAARAPRLLAQRVQAAFGPPDATEPAFPPRPRAEAEPRPSPSGLRAWVWPLLGAAAAAFVTGTYFAARAADHHGRIQGTYQNDPDVPGFQRSGRRAALLSDTFLGTGVLMAGTGVALWLWAPPDVPYPRGPAAGKEP